MAINLIPDSKPRGRGQHGEQINIAALDSAITRLLELHGALNNGTEKSAIGWVNEYIITGEPLDPKDVKGMLEKVYNEINTVHTALCSARQAQAEPRILQD